MAYIDKIKERARQDKKTIVLPETTDKRTLIAASHIIEEDIANVIMVGNEEKIMDGAGWLEVDLTGVKVVDPHNCDKLDSYVELLYETRKSKGMTPEKAREILLNDYLTFGVDESDLGTTLVAGVVGTVSMGITNGLSLITIIVLVPMWAIVIATAYAYRARKG